MEENVEAERHGFSRGRSTTDTIFTRRQKSERMIHGGCNCDAECIGLEKHGLVERELVFGEFS